jgi:DNA-binding GntR family transcriptional regulator
VPRITDAELARLDELVDRMAEHAKNEAVADFFALNVAFHELLCELSGNKKLLQVHHRLAGEIGRFQARTLALRGSLDGSVTEHRAILAAIRLRDVEKAAELTAAHVRVPAQRLLESVGAGGETMDDGEASGDLAPGTSEERAS